MFSPGQEMFLWPTPSCASVPLLVLHYTSSRVVVSGLGYRLFYIQLCLFDFRMELDCMLVHLEVGTGKVSHDHVVKLENLLRKEIIWSKMYTFCY